MEKYNYLEAVTYDVKSVLNEYPREEGETLYEYRERLHDELWIDDAVTGNGSGSYTFNAYKAEEYLCHNTDLLGEALRELGCGIDYLEKGAEACDVTIRCYLLPQAIAEATEDEE